MVNINETTWSKLQWGGASLTLTSLVTLAVLKRFNGAAYQSLAYPLGGAALLGSYGLAFSLLRGSTSQTDKKEELAKELKAAQAEVKKLEEDFEAKKEELAGAEKKVDELKKDHTTATEKLEKDHTTATEELKKDHTTATEELKKDHAVATEKLKKDHTTATKDLGDAQAEVKKLEEDHAVATKDLGDAQAEVKKLEEDLVVKEKKHEKDVDFLTKAACAIDLKRKSLIDFSGGEEYWNRRNSLFAYQIKMGCINFYNGNKIKETQRHTVECSFRFFGDLLSEGEGEGLETFKRVLKNGGCTKFSLPVGDKNNTFYLDPEITPMRNWEGRNDKGKMVERKYHKWGVRLNVKGEPIFQAYFRSKIKSRLIDLKNRFRCLTDNLSIDVYMRGQVGERRIDDLPFFKPMSEYLKPCGVNLKVLEDKDVPPGNPFVLLCLYIQSPLGIPEEELWEKWVAHAHLLCGKNAVWVVLKHEDYIHDVKRNALKDPDIGSGVMMGEPKAKKIPKMTTLIYESGFAVSKERVLAAGRDIVDLAIAVEKNKLEKK